jgi:hypothetical protein
LGVPTFHCAETPGKPGPYTFDGWLAGVAPITRTNGLVYPSISAENQTKVLDPYENRPTKDPKPIFKADPRPERRTGQAVAVVNPSGVAVKRQDKKSVPNPEGVGDRDIIIGRSQKSRRRLMDYLSRVDFQKLAGYQGKRTRYAKVLFVTLTYPKDFPGWRRAKRDLRTLKERLIYHYSLAWGVWVEEFQKRGAVHFHIILTFEKPVDLRCFRPWLSQAWYEVVGSEDPKHLKAGTQAVPVFSKRGVASLMGYLAGEMGKIKQTRPVDPETGELIETGRTWGFWYKDRVPFETLGVVVFETKEAWAMFKQRVASYFSKSGYLSHVHEFVSWGGALLYGDGRHLFKKLIEDLPGVHIRRPVRGVAA